MGSSATTNLLTSLPNAGSLFLSLDADLSRRPDFDGIGGDLDGFKQINERFGHLEGNKVLCALGNGLKSICREYHSVARMGGADNKASALQEIIAQTCHQLFGEILLTASVGVANYPEDTSDAEDLLAEADRRMYTQKRTASWSPGNRTPQGVETSWDAPSSANQFSKSEINP